jgi:hypothetical protein
MKISKLDDFDGERMHQVGNIITGAGEAFGIRNGV